MFYEEDDDSEDLFEQNIIKWNETESERFLNNFSMSLTSEESIQLDLDIIEKYYPGSAKLTDEEVIKRKYYPSEHSFQYAVSLKRMVEESGEGIVISDANGWQFGFGTGV